MIAMRAGSAPQDGAAPLRLDYDGINEAGLHRFSTPAMVMLMDDQYLGHVLTHDVLGPLHAEAMERAKA